MFHSSPLAERLRPQRLDEVIGQTHLVGKNGVLTKSLAKKIVPSMIFWGLPGIGKTTIAYVIAQETELPFVSLSAISSGVKEVREVIEKSKSRSKTLLFIDEIHRFSKSQQDALLGAVEKGWVTLIGATTENPSFEVNSALLSRCQVYKLYPLSESELISLLTVALEKDEKLKAKPFELQEHQALLRISGGDARKLLNLLELVTDSLENDLVITDAKVTEIAQQRIAIYDKTGEQHYDIISAFIKSIRGSDPNAAVYWLARMIEGGEDVKFIARRLLILASEDIGNANPTAMVIANNCFQAVNVIGYPESDIILAQCVTYLACSTKSNASYLSIREAQKLVREKGDLPVPLPLRNAPTALMKKEGYGKDYLYSHNFEGNFAFQEFMPSELAGTKLYDPQKNAREEEMRRQLRIWWKDKYGY